MKIGLIVESGPQGAEPQVLPKLIDKLGHKCDISIVTFDNKPKLIEGCGKAAEQLFDEGCDKVLIVWDLYPAWRVPEKKVKEGKKRKKAKPCRREDRLAIAASLTAAGIDPRWCRSSASKRNWRHGSPQMGALSAVLSRPTHPVSVKDCKRPDSMKKPKTYLRKLFRKEGHGDYLDRVHAPKIVDAMPDLTKLSKSVSFTRFAEILAR